MEILTIILPLLLALAKAWLERRAEARRVASDPKEQHKAKYEAIDEAIARDDALAASAGLNAALDDLERMQNARAKGDRKQ